MDVDSTGNKPAHAARTQEMRLDVVTLPVVKRRFA
jgi:hypothetical protein